ncbi:MAG: response regulator [Promethearchaeota archaeon]
MTKKKTTIASKISTEVKQGKILIIDDEEPIRKSLKKMLERAGFYCETAYNYSSAKEAVESLNFDLILVDIILPEMNGLRLVAKLQEEFKIDSVIIFVTGEPNLETALQAIKLGASDYLEKPANRNNLVAAITRALTRRGYNISVEGKNITKSIQLNSIIFQSEKNQINKELKEEFQTRLDIIHNALLELKRKFGEEFNEEQRSLLNQIAQSNAKLRKTLKNLEN